MHQLRLWLADHLIGPQCPICLERRRGPRTIAAHLRVDHVGETA